MVLPIGVGGLSKKTTYLKPAKQKKRDDFGYLVLNFHNAYEDNPRPLFKQLIEKYPLEK